MSSAGNPLASLVVKFIAEAAPFIQGTKEASEAVSHFSENVTGSLEKIAGVLGVGLGFEEITRESLKAFAAVEKAEISIGALTGSIEGARESIEKLKSLALSDALSFPELLRA